MKKQYYDIVDRQKEFDEVIKKIRRLELGIRAISLMYDEHSSDKNSKANIFRLKDNIYYRLSSAGHMYKLLLKELIEAERFCKEHEMHRTNHIELLSPNPYFEMLERNISAVFDSVVFNLVSVFDYFSHIVCYICNTQKTDTVYWTKLARTVRNPMNDLGKSFSSKIIDEADKDFVGRLYDYRSNLIHHKRESRDYSIERDPKTEKFNVKISLKSSEMKDFKLIYKDHDLDKLFTLSYLTSWLINKSCYFIEQILESLIDDIKDKSVYYDNIRGANGKGALVFMNVNPDTNRGEPVSELLWRQFKEQKLN
ncbi:hypothetical protein [Mucilaginibacter sp. R-33]|uniref:hypothetical protein n=1 Tax=unclassified Mucilaginibacter TaxID=2617802 RepID=UPI003CE81D2B